MAIPKMTAAELAELKAIALASLWPSTDEQMAAYEATVKLRKLPEKFRTPEFVFRAVREKKNQQSTMDITKMTAAERAELKAQLEAEERAEKQKREDDVAAYKSAVDEFCRLKFSRLKAMSEEMRRLKDEVFAEAETLIKLKEELFKRNPTATATSSPPPMVASRWRWATARTTAGTIRSKSVLPRSRSSSSRWPRMTTRQRWPRWL